MEKKIIIIAIVLFTSVACLLGQQGGFYKFKLKHQTKFKGNKILIKNIENKGLKESAHIEKLFAEESEELFKPVSGNTNVNEWANKPIYQKAAQESEADVVISGEYIVTSSSGNVEKLYYENGQFQGGALPYYELRNTHKASAQIVINYSYKDNSTDSDTIYAEKFFEKKSENTVTLEEVLEKCMKLVEYDLYAIFDYIEKEEQWYKFKKIKAPKEFKDELSDADEMLKNGKIKELGRLYKRIYEADKSNKEAAFNLAICYEILGNYPKAQEYYKISPDFHAKVRMKPHLAIVEEFERNGTQVNYAEL